MADRSPSGFHRSALVAGLLALLLEVAVLAPSVAHPARTRGGGALVLAGRCRAAVAAAAQAARLPARLRPDRLPRAEAAGQAAVAVPLRVRVAATAGQICEERVKSGSKSKKLIHTHNMPCTS